MTVTKEPSDELNPPHVVSAPVVPRRKIQRTPKDYFALAVATCGVGYFPIAPGTWGSLVAVGIYFALESCTYALMRTFGGEQGGFVFSPWSVFLAVELVVITVAVHLGIWAATRVEALAARKDPGKVVIDEVAGQLIALLPIVPGVDRGWVTIIAAFLLFRLFDIIKPYPARRLEGLESGLGIMADDVVAGAYAAVCVSVLVAYGIRN
jgi:phosphatidylglycerophosphatase A